MYNVGFLKGHPVIRLMTLGFIIGAEELGYEYKLLLSDGADYAKFVQDLEQANAEGASAVVGFIGDPSQGPAVAALGESGIPFCSAHFPQEEGDYPGLTAWAATETVPYAEAAARAMGEELRKRGVTEGSLAITQGNFNTVENLVAETFAATIKAEYPEFTPLESQEEGFDPPVAIAKAVAIIQANPDIVGALSTTGAGPTTWARAAEENGLEDGEIVIISMDYTRPNLDLVKEGKVFGLVGQPLVAEFRECVYVMDKVLRGEDYDYANPLPAPIITFDDLDEYYAFNDMVEEYLGASPEAEAEGRGRLYHRGQGNVQRRLLEGASGDPADDAGLYHRRRGAGLRVQALAERWRGLCQVCAGPGAGERRRGVSRGRLYRRPVSGTGGGCVGRIGHSLLFGALSAGGRGLSGADGLGGDRDRAVCRGSGPGHGRRAAQAGCDRGQSGHHPGQL